MIIVSFTRKFGRALFRSVAASAAGLLVMLGVLAPGASQAQSPKVPAPEMGRPTSEPGGGLARATFAGGCFWCMEAPFDTIDGVLSTTSGYIGGKEKRPDYKTVSAGATGHTEAVEIVYDPKKVSFEKLLEVYWVNVDPTIKDGQFCDMGTQYRPEIFVHNAEQKRLADASKAELIKNKPFKADILVNITAASDFWPAEDYHQDYYRKNPLRYKYYRNGCGRDSRLKVLWGAKAGGAH